MATVTIQQGHCWLKVGPTGTNGEQVYVDKLAAATAAQLARCGHTAHRILAQPGAYPKADVFIALHCDGSVDPRARGMAFGYRTDLPTAERSHALGVRWFVEHTRAGYPSGCRRINYTTGLARYYALDDAWRAGARAAIIIEAGFLTNPGDRAWLNGHVVDVAAGLVRAIDAFFPVGTNKQQPHPNPWPRPDVCRRLLMTGSRGMAVKWVQWAVRTSIDGVYGPLTTRAVIAFQRAHGLAADGIVGPKTAAKLAAVLR